MSNPCRTLVSLSLITIALVAAFSIAAGGRVAAQDTTTVTTSEPAPTTLSLTGHGTVTIEPDTAAVSFGVTIDDETLSTAQNEATATMTEILAAVTDAGIVERDVQTVDYRVDILYDYDDDGTVSRILGYQVSNTVNVAVRDLGTVGAILDAVVAAGANTVYGISFYVENTTAAASQARTAAVADAITKAEDIATAAGLRVSRIVSIYESSSPPPAPMDYDYAVAESADSAGSSVPVQAGTTEISADIDVVFELEPAA